MYQHTVNQNFDTRYTKIYVRRLLWTTREGLRNFFEQFSEIIHVNVVYNRVTRRSEGFGFVRFRDVDSTTRACQNQFPIIEGRGTQCNLAYLGARVNNNQNGQQLATYIPYWYQHDAQHYYPVNPYYPVNLYYPLNLYYPVNPYYPYPQFWTQHGRY